MTELAGTDRAALVAAARDVIARGSQSFAAASKLFAQDTRERAWLLYAWCRAADDMTDGQVMGHAAQGASDPAAVQAELETLTAAALDGNEPLPVPFAALRAVVRETGMPRHLVTDHLGGFALDAAHWRPHDENELLLYCYHVAGSVGCMMAVVMGVDPADEDTLDRACDLGLAFQLANIARDIVADAEVGRCYIPATWLAQWNIDEGDIVSSAARPALAGIASQLITLANPYRASARMGAACLPFRSRLAVLAADAIYGAIGERVVAQGDSAWDERVHVGKARKLALFIRAMIRALSFGSSRPRKDLWTRPVSQSELQVPATERVRRRATEPSVAQQEAHRGNQS